MHIVIGISSRETDSRQVKINCPVCHKTETPALARDMTEKLTLFHLVPFFISKATFVGCSCGASLLSSQKANVLANVDSDFGARYLRLRVSPIVKALVLGGLFAWFLPVAGLIWNGCALAAAWRYRGWMQKTSGVLCALSLLTTAALFLPTTGPADPARRKEPNQPLQPTSTAVTPPASAFELLRRDKYTPVAPRSGVARL